MPRKTKRESFPSIPPSISPPAPKLPASNSTAQDGFFSAFFGKLREQSFTILVMVAIIYYQNMMWERDRAEYKATFATYQARYETLVAEERQRLLDHERYLTAQRDAFLEHLKEQAARAEKK